VPSCDTFFITVVYTEGVLVQIDLKLKTSFVEEEKSIEAEVKNATTNSEPVERKTKLSVNVLEKSRFNLSDEVKGFSYLKQAFYHCARGGIYSLSTPHSLISIQAY
jgi:hypothetical protein